MIWNRKKNERSHLVYAEYEKVTDAGAWRNNLSEETFHVHERIDTLDKKMTEHMKELKEEIRGLAENMMLKNKFTIADRVGGAFKKNKE